MILDPMLAWSYIYPCLNRFFLTFIPSGSISVKKFMLGHVLKHAAILLAQWTWPVLKMIGFTFWINFLFHNAGAQNYRAGWYILISGGVYPNTWGCVFLTQGLHIFVCNGLQSKLYIPGVYNRVFQNARKSKNLRDWLAKYVVLHN